MWMLFKKINVYVYLSLFDIRDHDYKLVDILWAEQE